MCLKSIVAQNYPKDKVEVLVVDGMSEDETRKIVRQYMQEFPFIKLLDNTRKVTSVAMNIGIESASGDYVIVLSSHSKIEQNFVKINVNSFRQYNPDCTGGVMITLPANHKPLAQCIALAISNPFGVGNAYFRIGTKKPKFVDTVPFGCYKRKIFDKIGLFDEELIRNQDDELNARLIKSGGRILLDPEIISYYHARDSLTKLWKMYFQYGYFKPLVVLKIGGVPTWRQLVPILFVGCLIIFAALSFITRTFMWLFLFTVLIYLMCSIVCSFLIVLKQKLTYILILPVVFAVLHFSYGTGYVKGILDFIFLRKHLKKKIVDIPLSR